MLDQLRDWVWDYLYQMGEAQSLDHLAEIAQQDPETMQAVVEHEWFHVAGGHVNIAYGKGPFGKRHG